MGSGGCWAMAGVAQQIARARTTRRFMTSSSKPFVPSAGDSYDVIWRRASGHQSPTDGVMDEAELEQLHPASYAWSLSCCGRDRAEAEEVLQDVYVKILDGKARFDGRSSLKTWLFAVIRRTAASHGRARMLHEVLNAKWVRRQPEDQVPSPDRLAERSETSTALLAALQKLSRRQREVLELVFYHDMTIEEAAAAMSVSLGSARVHYQRGKKNL